MRRLSIHNPDRTSLTPIRGESDWRAAAQDRASAIG
jgi:hypothetical protein